MYARLVALAVRYQCDDPGMKLRYRQDFVFVINGVMISNGTRDFGESNSSIRQIAGCCVIELEKYFRTFMPKFLSGTSIGWTPPKLRRFNRFEL